MSVPAGSSRSNKVPQGSPVEEALDRMGRPPGHAPACLCTRCEAHKESLATVRERLDSLTAQVERLTAKSERQATNIGALYRQRREAQAQVERLTEERDALEACDCIPAEFSSKGCPKCGRRGVVTETTIHTLMVEIRDKDAEVSRLTGLLEHTTEGLRDAEDLLLRLRDSALRGRGGTPDYWIGEIDALLAVSSRPPGDTEDDPAFGLKGNQKLRELGLGYTPAKPEGGEA